MAKDTNADWAEDCMPQLFVGRYDGKVCHEGRICIPAEWRSRFDGDRVFAMRDIAEPNAICLMPESLYEMELAAMKGEDYSAEQQNALLIAKHLRLDVCGRIKLPKELLEMFGETLASHSLDASGQFGFIHIKNSLALMKKPC